MIHFVKKCVCFSSSSSFSFTGAAVSCLFAIAVVVVQWSTSTAFDFPVGGGVVVTTTARSIATRRTGTSPSATSHYRVIKSRVVPLYSSSDRHNNNNHRHDDEENGAEEGRNSVNRRSFLSLSGALGLVTSTSSASVFTTFSPVAAAATASEYAGVRDVVNAAFPALSAETCLLGLLPVTNTVFRRIQKDLEQVSYLRISAVDETAWKIASKASTAVLKFLDGNRGKLEPVFNEDDPTMIFMAKAERGERLIGELRNHIQDMTDAISLRDASTTYDAQKRALMVLSRIGDMLVAQYPFTVPSEGKYSYLPRLLGRATVTFAFTRQSKPLGNVTIIADGYAAPITAGNFVDLSVRGFYTGLPVKAAKKRLGGVSFPNENDDYAIIPETIKALPQLVRGRLRGAAGGADAEMADWTGASDDASSLTVPVLGSYQEGFYDPLTAKPRRIPLEIAKVDNAGVARMTYPGDAKRLGDSDVLSFDIPGLVAMNHPDKFPNGGSSEFFVVPSAGRGLSPEKVRMIDGSYAPFGYVISGMDLLRRLEPGDVISATIVDEVGIANLKKLRETSFADVIQSSNLDNED
mmetsp:Transcript_8966/g.11011  ORF Transcript_8966/g.11011 Transcript_8966/m.11011 type:complete len:578 (+) Transcript_8966:109-1842(+)